MPNRIARLGMRRLRNGEVFSWPARNDAEIFFPFSQRRSPIRSLPKALSSTMAKTKSPLHITAQGTEWLKAITIF